MDEFDLYFFFFFFVDIHQTKHLNDHSNNVITNNENQLYELHKNEHEKSFVKTSNSKSRRKSEELNLFKMLIKYIINRNNYMNH